MLHCFDEIKKNRKGHRILFLGTINGDRADLAVTRVFDVLAHHSPYFETNL